MFMSIVCLMLNFQPCPAGLTENISVKKKIVLTLILVNLMDYTTLKSLNDGCLSIKSKLNVELEKVSQ